MNFRIAALFGALLLLTTGCPGNNGNGDGGVVIEDDGGVIPPAGGCTGGCGPNQICDENARRCVSACQPACPLNQLCVKQGDAHVCEPAAVSCAGNVCETGQSACVEDTCSCLTFVEASRDTCAESGRVCPQPFNSVTGQGGACQNPGPFQICSRECPGGDCGTCPSGFACDDSGFWQGFGFCNRTCEAEADCSVEEICNTQGGFCYPKSLFSPVQNTLPGRTCFQARMQDLPDGGQMKEYFRVNPSQLCIATSQNGGTLNAAEDLNPTGTCTWLVLQTANRLVEQQTCRPPGAVPAGGTCNPEPMQRGTSSTCQTGLECVPQGRTGEGVCLPICNAKPLPDGSPDTPACGAGEACFDFRRIDTVDSIPGACAQTCNVFAAGPNHGCADVGGRATSCVPTTLRGDVALSATGTGLCLPQLPSVAAEGQACSETDPLRGAACESGLTCTRVGGEAQPRCVKPCDLECSGENPPARCATLSGTTCASGQTCTAVNSGAANTAGFCL